MPSPDDNPKPYNPLPLNPEPLNPEPLNPTLGLSPEPIPPPLLKSLCMHLQKARFPTSNLFLPLSILKKNKLSDKLGFPIDSRLLGKPGKKHPTREVLEL